MGTNNASIEMNQIFKIIMNVLLLNFNKNPLDLMCQCCVIHSVSVGNEYLKKLINRY